MSSAKDITQKLRRIRKQDVETVREAVRGKLGAVEFSGRTHKSIATRERILSSACELMVKRGGTDFQMAEIAKMCNMSKGSLYYYFADRESLVNAAFERAANELADAVTQAVSQAPNALEALANIVYEISRQLSVGSPLALALTHDLTLGMSLRAASEHTETERPDTRGSMLKILRVVAAQLDRGKREGLISPDVDSELAASFITGGFHATLQMHAGELGREGAEEFVRRLFKSVLFGIASPAYRDKLAHLVS